MYIDSYYDEIQINGQDISWQHLVSLYQKHQHDLTTQKKLKWEHINLTSYSKMRVDLAAQVANYVLILRLVFLQS